MNLIIIGVIIGAAAASLISKAQAQQKKALAFVPADSNKKRKKS